MSRQDVSRERTGRYAIIKSRHGSGYLVVEVLVRDEYGNVKCMKQNVLSYPDTIEEGQKLLDKWNSGADLALINQYEAWRENNVTLHLSKVRNMAKLCLCARADGCAQ